MAFKVHRKGGVSWFTWRTGFAINNGQFPNICVMWAPWGKMIYMALSHRKKLVWVRG